MSIIRSNIARQLLAEGGAPRKGFQRGGVNEADVEAGLATESMSDFTSDNYGEDFQGSSFGSNQGDMGSPPGGDFDNIDFSNVTARDLRNISIRPDGTSDAGSIFDFLPTSIIRRADQKFIGPFRDKSNLARRTEFLRREGLIGPGEEELPVQFQDSFLKSQAGLEMLRNLGYTTIQDVINKGEGGDNEPIRRLRAPITEKKEEPKDEFADILKFYGARFEDGGDVRQEYGLGSIVKKATRAVKKVAKSPLGKAALAFGAYKLAGSPKIFGEDSFIGKLTADKAFKGILGASLAAGLFAKQDEEDEKLPTVANTDPDMVRTLEFYGGPRRFAAEGGMMEQDEMLDLGGKEMDLRGGGFVPLGEYEKKDDVPARLSKNEFVFTADAVRAAGGGSVDKGADVMYKTMKTLENKVA